MESTRARGPGGFSATRDRRVRCGGVGSIDERSTGGSRRRTVVDHGNRPGQGSVGSGVADRSRAAERAPCCRLEFELFRSTLESPSRRAARPSREMCALQGTNAHRRRSTRSRSSCDTRAVCRVSLGDVDVDVNGRGRELGVVEPRVRPIVAEQLVV